MAGQFSRNVVAGVTQILITSATLFAIYYYAIRALGAEAIGLWSLVLAGAGMSRLADFGFGAAATKHVAHDVELSNFSDAKGVLVAGSLVVAFSTGIFILALWLIHDIYFGSALNSEDTRALAEGILPLALLSVWLASTASVLLGGLDGLQRIDLRVAVVVTASLGQLLVTMTLIPRVGIYGLVLGHLAQSIILASVSAAVLKRRFGKLCNDSFTLDFRRLRSVARYGGGVQLANILQMTVDPVVRMLLSRFGTLEMTGYFEMATRLVIQARSLVVAGHQAIIPHVAAVAARGDVAASRAVYAHAYRFSAQLGIPFYGVLLAALPAIACVWLSGDRQDFLVFGAIGVVAWAMNTLSVPAYYVFLGTGRLASIITGQLSTAASNVLFGVLFGTYFGGYGVALGYGVAITLGSVVVIGGFALRESKRLKGILPPVGWFGALVVLLAAMFYLLILDRHLLDDPGPSIFQTALVFLAPALLGGIVIAGLVAPMRLAREIVSSFD